MEKHEQYTRAIKLLEEAARLLNVAYADHCLSATPQTREELDEREFIALLDRVIELADKFGAQWDEAIATLDLKRAA